MLNTITQTIKDTLTEEGITVKSAVKFLNEKEIKVDYRQVYRIFRTHGTKCSKGIFKKKAETEQTLSNESSDHLPESISTAETSSKAA